MQPIPPLVKFCNVGNFEPIPVSSFSFGAEIKNEFHEGSAACQLSAIILVTDANPIIIPFSIKGCASELNLLSVDKGVSGKTADLSGFTIDDSNWARVACKSDSGKIRYYVNEKLAYDCPAPKKPVRILGMSFIFQGTGAVKNIRLRNSTQEVFQAF